MVTLVVFFHLLANVFLIVASTTDPGIIPKLNLDYVSTDQYVHLPRRVQEFDSILRNQH